MCFCHELTKHGLSFQRQAGGPIVDYGIKFEEDFHLDGLVEDSIICELKAVEMMDTVFQAQVLTQLRLAGKRLGFLINFNVPLIKSGLERIIL